VVGNNLSDSRNLLTGIHYSSRLLFLTDCPANSFSKRAFFNGNVHSGRGPCLAISYRGREEHGETTVGGIATRRQDRVVGRVVVLSTDVLLVRSWIVFPRVSSAGSALSVAIAEPFPGLPTPAKHYHPPL